MRNASAKHLYERLNAVRQIQTPHVFLDGQMTLITPQVDHELSVPAVSSMLLSCAAWTVTAVSGTALFASVSDKTQQRLTAFTALCALALQVAVRSETK